MTDNNRLSFVHANAINLARRWSVQNENDLMQENLYEDTLDEVKSPMYDRKTCQEMASHLMHVKSLPKECMKFQDITADLQRRDSDTTHGSQILS